MTFTEEDPAFFDYRHFVELVRSGEIAPERVIYLTSLWHSFRRILYYADRGSIREKTQLKAIEKIINAEQYDISPTVIKTIASYKGNASIARGMHLRLLMRMIGTCVRSKHSTAKNLLDGPVLLLDSPSIIALPTVCDRVKNLIKTNSTLLSLAIDYFLEYLPPTEKPTLMEMRTLKRDLKNAEKWIERNADWIGHFPQPSLNPELDSLLPVILQTEIWIDKLMGIRQD